jgi:surface polysaccharide O-acyltransferase-like enzyme
MNNSIIQGYGMDSVKLQSATIDLLRFPLAIMVIFNHMNPKVINLFDADFSLISGHGIYNVTGVLLSHVLTHIAVPTFYLISGFLFFINFQKWSWKGYKKKLSSRIKTLLVPYLLWNAIPFLLAVLAMLAAVAIKGKPIEGVETFIVEKNWHIFYDCNEWGTTRINWLGENLRMTGPYDLPLWFLRDLIVVTMMTPIIYYAIKKSGLFIISILFVAYISRIWTLLPGFHITAFFYFSTGAYFALNKINVIQFVDKYKLLFIPICIILLVATTIYDGANTVIGQNIYPLFVCTGVLTVFYVASRCIIKHNIKPNKLLVSSCFFIYAIHEVGFPLIGSPLGLTRRVLHYIIPGNSGIEEGFCYIISPIVTAFLCILLLMFARRLFPKLTLYFSGNK